MGYISKKEIELIDGYFRASNYLSVAQLYLMDNPLLFEPLKLEHLKPNPVGHFGTTPGQNFIYVHCNRVIKKFNLKMIYISGPGHGGQAMIAQNYLDGTYTKYNPSYTEDLAGLKKLVRNFAFPRGVSSHCEANIPGSIHTGGELGYSLAHAAGAVLDNPELIATCVVGDGEAETGPLATSWNVNKFINKKTDGVVLPILHRNGYKISNPTVFGRMTDREITYFFESLGWKVYFVEGRDTFVMHEKMANTMDRVISDIEKIKATGKGEYPMIILTTPKGWLGPKAFNGKKIEDSFRAHQIPIYFSKEEPGNFDIIERWLRSYHPETLFDKDGRFLQKYRDLAPSPTHTMGASPYANGGILTKRIICPVLDPYIIDIKEPGRINRQDTKVLSQYIRDLFILNKENKNFRVFGPDEALSNRLNFMFDVEKRTWNYRIFKDDEYLSTTGRIMDSYLSEHLCEGMLEGYVLTGRYGFLHSYEAFARVIESMMGQHGKWLKFASELSWREDIPSLNFLLTSHAFQQDHNGYTHQDPGFVNTLINKKYDVVRAYYPPDSNTLLFTFDKVIKSKNLINAIIASKHPRPQWFTVDDAKKLINKGVSIVDFASNDGDDPDLVMVATGETPFLELLGAVDILRRSIKNIKIRVVYVLNLFVLDKNHPDGLTDDEYNKIFTEDRPIIYNYHGYTTGLRDLIFDRKNKNIIMRGYREEGNITTSFDIRVMNKIDRFHLVIDAMKMLPKYQRNGKVLIEWCESMLKEHLRYIKKHGEDMPYIKNWKWDNDLK
ncbi:MAG: phosphoketolase family protein [Bacilli bacterium]|nr:phosphoketolase family protein [Bacilli bacterium]